MSSIEAVHPLVQVFTYAGQLSDTPPAKPWLLTVDGVDWLAATQGHFLVAIKSPEAGIGEPPPSRFEKAAKYIEASLHDAVDLSLAAVVAWAGKVLPSPAPESCSECEGSGYGFGELVLCEHCGHTTRTECTACGGEKTTTPLLEQRYGSIAGVSVNRALLAFGLSLVPARETVTVGHSIALRNDTYKALVVDGGDWRVVVMSISESAALSNPCPEFEGA